jgi:hypothetical protein
MPLRPALLALLCTCSIAAAAPARLFLIGEKKATSATILRTPDPAPEPQPAPEAQPAPDPSMLLYLRGILSIATPKDLATLRSAAAGTRLTDPDDTARFFARIQITLGEDHADLLMLRDAAGAYYLKRSDWEKSVTLRADKVDSLVASWPAYRGTFETPDTKSFSPPYTPSPYVLDRPLLGDRFRHGTPTKLDGTTRRLDQEAFVCRLPKGHNPRLASGLLVWVHAGPDAVIPPSFTRALDELGIACIAAGNTGNDRPAADRYQLTLDAVATASERILIDPRRIYATGISGGGKISSMTWACFPDLFAGALPIVGLSTYENIPNGLGQYWHGDFGRPAESLFKLARAGRLAAITGDKDFNHDAIVEGMKLYARDHFTTRVFDITGLAHELPKPDLFAQALSWLDEPYRAVRTEETAAAKNSVDKAAAATDEADRRRLWTQAVAAAPWSEPAWEACEKLGASPPK